MPSAADPANPASTLPPQILRTFRAPCFTIVLSIVTWPSPAIASLPSRRTAKIVVDLMRASLPRGHEEGFIGERLDGGERALGQHAPALALVLGYAAGANGTVERSPGHVGGLKVRRRGILQMRDDRPQGRRSRKIDRRQAEHRPRG